MRLTIFMLIFLVSGCVSMSQQQPLKVLSKYESNNYDSNKSVKLEKIIIRANAGDYIGDVNAGLACIKHDELKYKSSKIDLDGVDYTQRFYSILSASGYNVSGDNFNVFDSVENSVSDYKIGAVISNLKANFCFPFGGFNNTSDVTGTASMSVEWQVFSTKENKTILKVNTSGSYNTSVMTKNFSDVISNAFHENIVDFVSSSEFQLVLGLKKGFENNIQGIEIKRSSNQGLINQMIENPTPFNSMGTYTLNEGSSHNISIKNFPLTFNVVLDFDNMTSYKVLKRIEKNGKIYDVILTKCSKLGVCQIAIDPSGKGYPISLGALSLLKLSDKPLNISFIKSK